jgi:hypothetical protein
MVIELKFSREQYGDLKYSRGRGRKKSPDSITKPEILFINRREFYDFGLEIIPRK